MDKKNIYLIKLLTNMHVGSGDINYNIVDNEVQRDIVNKYPIINSSSLKGALKEYFSSKLGKESGKVVHIFGNYDNMGRYKFFSGNLLTMPVRSNKNYFFRAVCPETINNFLKFLNYFGSEIELEEVLNNFKGLVNENECVIFRDYGNDENIQIETYDCLKKDFKDISKIENLIGTNIVLLSNDIFEDIVNNLPVIARNHLENGESKNLWYEEVVPREAIFYFGVISDGEYIEDFENILSEDMIQIGANASIGYGYTEMFKFNGLVGDKK